MKGIFISTFCPAGIGVGLCLQNLMDERVNFLRLNSGGFGSFDFRKYKRVKAPVLGNDIAKPMGVRHKIVKRRLRIQGNSLGWLPVFQAQAASP